jgi:hypothetical protein
VAEAARTKIEKFKDCSPPFLQYDVAPISLRICDDMMTSSKTLSKMGLLLDTKLNWSGHIKMQP